MTAVLYKTNGEKISVIPQDGKYFSLQELQSLVGGCIEVTPVPGTDLVLIVNEEGKSEGLSYNLPATALLKGFLQAGDSIVGHALICDRQQLDEGDED